MLRHLKPLAAAANAAAIVAVILKAAWYIELADLIWIVLTPVFIAAVTLIARRARLSSAEVLTHGTINLAIIPIALAHCWRGSGWGVYVAGMIGLAALLNFTLLVRLCLRLRLWRWQKRLAVRR